MRPRVFPAEDGDVAGGVPTPPARFNEAAGIPRGRLMQLGQFNDSTRASMRPRVFPAEDARRT